MTFSDTPFRVMAIVTLAALISAVAIVWPAARICRRAGYSPLLGIVALVPLVNIALLWFIAVSPWQTDRR